MNEKKIVCASLNSVHFHPRQGCLDLQEHLVHKHFPQIQENYHSHQLEKFQAQLQKTSFHCFYQLLLSKKYF